MKKEDFYTFAEANQMWAEKKGFATSKTYYSLLSEIKAQLSHIKDRVLEVKKSENLGNLSFYQLHCHEKYFEDKSLIKKWIKIVIKHRQIKYNFLYKLLHENFSIWIEETNNTFTEYDYTILYCNKEEVLHTDGFISHKGDLIPLLLEKEYFDKFLDNVHSRPIDLEISDLKRILHLPEGELLQYGLGMKDDTIKELHRNGNPHKGGRTPLADHLKNKYPQVTEQYSTIIARLLHKAIS